MSTRLFKVGFATTDTAGDVQFMVSSPGSGNYDSFQQHAAAFQVTSGKTLYIGQITLNGGGTAQFTAYYFSTASVSNSATPPAGNTNLGQGQVQLLAGTNSTAPSVSYNVLFTIPQNDFFNGFANGSINGIDAWGLMF